MEQELSANPKAVIGKDDVDKAWVLVNQSVRINVDEVSNQTSESFGHLPLIGWAVLLHEPAIAEADSHFRQVAECMTLRGQYVREWSREEEE